MDTYGKGSETENQGGRRKNNENGLTQVKADNKLRTGEYGMDLESSMLSEVSQRKTNIV